MRPDVVTHIYPGIKYEELIRQVISSENFWREVDNVDREIEKRLAEYRSEKLSWDVALSSGKWITVRKSILPDGSLISFHTDITARKLAEDSQRNLFDYASDSIFVSDPVTRKFIDVNNNAADRLGYSREELLQLGYADITDPDIDISPILEELKRTGKVQAETVHIRKDGSKMPVEVTSRLIDLGENRVQQTFVRDISGRKRIESVLKESEERFSKAFQASPMMQSISRLDDGAIVDVNKSWLSNLDFTRDEVIGKTAKELNLTVDFSMEIRSTLIDKILESRAPVKFEGKLRQKNGKVLEFDSTADIIEIGGAEHLLLVSEDVTEHRRVERAVKESEERFRAIFQSTPAMVSISTETGSEILEVNETWLRTLGYERDEVVGKTPFGLEMLIDPDIRPKATRQLNDEENVVVETQYRTKTGEIRDFIVSGKKIYFDEKDCILFVSQDITAEKAREDHLRHAQKMEAVGQLTGGLAHDFNNLLLTAIGNIEIIEENVEDAPQLKERTRAAKRAVQKGAELTKRLLAFSRKQQLNPVPTDVSRLANELRVMIRRILPENIDVIWHQPPNLWPALVDANQLENAILNLALNSKDAMVAGGTITISSAQQTLVEGQLPNIPDAQCGEFVTVTVEDTGMGIRQAELDKIFDPFFTTKGVGEGSGLGLSMVYGFVRQSGGFIDIDSEPAEGTRITLYLPRAESDLETVKHSEGKIETVAANSKKGFSGRDKRVLVVEDEPMVREITISLLELLDFDVTDGGDGDNIDDFLDKEEFDLVLSDVVLSNRLSGPDVVETVLKRHESAKALLMTGYAEQDVIRSADGDLKYPVITKPFGKEELTKKLEEVFRQSEY